MLTNDKSITQPAYWDKIYRGENNGAKVDASDTKRTSTFDRFEIVVNHAEGNKILGVGSGHARIEARLKAKYPNAYIVASDQSVAAKEVSNYFPYVICDAYNLPFLDKWFDMVIATQMMEYLDDNDKFLTEAKRVAHKFLCTVPKGEMKAWSQLRLYDENNFKQFLEQYGTIEVFEDYEHIILAKIRFYE